MESPPPIIVLGRRLTGLGAVRCLARRGLTVYSACDDVIVPRSRYFRAAVTSSGQRWRCELGEQGERMLADMPFEKAVIIPCADDMTQWVANLPDELKTRFPSSIAPVDALDALMDKRLFAGLCKRLNVPHPRSYLVNSPEDLDQVPFEEMPRAFLKPANSNSFSKTFGVKAKWARNREEAKTIVRTVCDADQSVFVQEYVAGGAFDHYFIDGFMDRNGTVRATFARRRQRIFPPDFGNSSYCYNVALESVQPAWESLQRILREVAYRGIFSAEFKQDSRDGQYKILEINTRAWLYVEFAAWCGINVCHLAYLDACGLPTPDLLVTKHGRGCSDFSQDVQSYFRSPRSERMALWRVMKQWLLARKLVFAFDDPYPAFREVISSAGGLARRFLRLQSRKRKSLL